MTRLLPEETHTDDREFAKATLGQVAVIVPTANAAMHWPGLLAGLSRQGLSPQQVLIVDSTSTDGTADLACQAGYRLLSIARSDFNHGGTRQVAADLMSNAEILVYLTQDAILFDDNAILELILPFRDPLIGATFGRQLPRLGAGPQEAHARHFNYPAVSQVRELASKEHLGFKSVFSSNSFAAYRAKALREVQGFPTNVVVSEETVVSARLILAGWKTAYVAEAMVRHSHDYSYREEFRRYFDIGVLHAAEPWILREFGAVSGEGRRFVTSEFRSLWPRHAHLIPSSILRSLLKLVAYRLGGLSDHLAPRIAEQLSQQKHYWR